jgi:tripartite-type tricarboxylate transporter receptor subunit TctC
MPTVAASGLPGYESSATHGIFAPAKTPAPIIQRLNQEIVKVLNQPAVKEKFLSIGTTVVGSSPEQLTAAVKHEMATSGKLIKALGIRGD